MQDISCLVLPIPAHAFFKQAVLQGEIGHHLLQGGGFTTKVLHLAGRRGAGGVARQPALAGLQELLRPAVIHRGGDAFPAAQLRDVLLATQSFQHNADLLFGRILLPRRPADVADKLLGRTSGGNGFLSHLRSLAATMSQKSSVPQATKFVSQALKQDRHSIMPSLVHILDVIVLVRLPVAVFSLAFRKSMPMPWSGCVLPMTPRERPYIWARVRMQAVISVRRHHQHSTC